MRFFSIFGSIPIMLSVFAIVITCVNLVLALPVSNEPASRTARNVDSHRRNSQWNEDLGSNLLLSQVQQNETDPIFAQRENQTGDGTSSAEDGDGSNEVEVDDGDGTFSNDTQAGSRLKQNETEPCSLEPAILCSSLSPTHSNRDKQRRLANIVNYFWTNVFGNRTRSSNKDMTRERFNPVNPSSSSFSGGLETIRASCDLPPEVESEAWTSERYFSLYFNLTSKYPDILGAYFPTSVENTSTEPQQQRVDESLESGHSQEYLPVAGSRPFTITVTPTKLVNIISAKLRLYKIGTSENSMPSVADIERTSEPCNDTDVNSSGSDEVVPIVFPTTRMTFPEFSPSADEKIRVSVFWYTQPALKNHYKKKLVDAKMLSLRESSWVEFDIKNAVTAWLNERKPNYGLVIEVENENQDALNPRNYFRGAPCFQSTSSSDGTVDNGDERTGRDVDSAMSPVIEICTLNVPQATSSYEHTKFFPYSMNINSLTHLQRVAEIHAKSSNSSSRPRFPSAQNINLRVISPEDFGSIDPNGHSSSRNDPSDSPRQTIVLPNPNHHHHRHHHQLPSQSGNQRGDATGEGRQQRGKGRSSGHPQQFTLADDHPLRQILTNSWNGNSKESNKRVSGSQQFPEGKGFPSHLIPEMPADEGRAEADYIDSTEHDRDVFITKIIISPAQLKNGLANRRGFLPFANSMATSASSSSVSPTRPTSADSSER